MKIKLDSSLFPSAITIYDTDTPEATRYVERLFQPTVIAEQGGKIVYASGQTNHRVWFWLIIAALAYFLISKLKG